MWKMVVAVAAMTVLAFAGISRGEEPAHPGLMGIKRATALRSDLARFQMRLNYTGDQKKPFYDLRLSVSEPLEKAGNDHQLRARITEEEAGKLVDFLAGDGFLDGALDGNRNRGPAAPKEPYCTLIVLVNQGPDQVLYEQWMPLNYKMMVRLDGLRKALGDAPGKAMDTLLGRMSEERKQWTKEALTSPATEKDGLSAVLRLGAAEFGPDDAVKFEVEFKNISSKAMVLADAGDYFGNWKMRFDGGEGVGIWEVRQTMSEATRKATNTLLKPGEILTVRVELGAPPQGFDFVPMNRDKKIAALNRLKAGKYQLTAVVTLEEGLVAQEGVAGFWTGTIAAGPMDLEIKATPAKGDTGKESGGKADGK